LLLELTGELPILKHVLGGHQNFTASSPEHD
jgi:hypothetical protein